VLPEVGHTGILEWTIEKMMGNNERKIVSRHSEKSGSSIVREPAEVSGISRASVCVEGNIFLK
jgi:hypothetical protein